MYQKIINEYEKIRDLPKGKILDKLDRKLYREMPENTEEFVNVCNELVQTNKWRPYWLVTMWVKRKQTAYDIKYFEFYERWLYEYTDSWGACDVFCYRILNPMVEKYPELFKNVLEWAQSSKTYVKRASAVCLIQSTDRSFRVNVEFERVKQIVDILISDKELHIQKGIGWLLKYAYLTYPNETIQYLKDNVSVMSRTTFRYALEKMDSGLRAELMSL